MDVLSSPVVRAVVAVALPIVVFFGAGWIMVKISGQEPATQRIEALRAREDRTPLNRRLHYDADAVSRYWKPLKDDLTARAAEQRLLELDLVFPFPYGGALAAGLLLVWAGLGRRFAPAWVMAPVAVGMVADWTENLVQLSQLRRYTAGEALDGGWIALAGAATLVKIVCLTLAFGLLLVLAAWLLFSPSRPS